MASWFNNFLPAASPAGRDFNPCKGRDELQSPDSRGTQAGLVYLHAALEP